VAVGDAVFMRPFAGLRTYGKPGMRTKNFSRFVKGWRVLLTVGIAQVVVFGGCATIKRSDTARTGLEQLLVSSAIDRALGGIDWSPIRGAPVFVETKYLDCVDKNYVIVAVHQRLLASGCTLVDKAEDSAVTIEIGSGAVGTDHLESYLGIPEISLPASQIALPKLAIFTRDKSNGTAKLAVLAYDTKNKLPVINAGATLARSDHSDWSVLGMGPVVSGSVPTELKAATGESEWSMGSTPLVAERAPATVIR
jgi:hypothetical protein